MIAEYIEKCRKKALEVIKPSEKELRHGLELHKESLVFDSYGFFPSGIGSQADADILDSLIENGASRSALTAEMTFRSKTFLNNPEMRAEVKFMLEDCGVDCIYQNSGEESNDHELLVDRLSAFMWVTDNHSDIVARASRPEDIERLHKEGRKCLYTTTNGVPLPARLTNLEDALRFIQIYSNLGVRMMHLTYNRRNLIADGCAEEADAGLSRFGEAVIERMNRIGILPDVAHTGQRSSYEAAKCSKKPVVASHSFAYALSSHFRGKTDQVIEAIAQSGGYVGVCCYPQFLQRSGMIDSLLDHIEYIARKFGVDHVAIGTDLSGFSFAEFTPKKNAVHEAIFEQYWPKLDNPFNPTQDMYDSLAWVNWPLYTVGLVQRGFTDDEIRKIIGGNVMRVAKETLA